MLQTNDKQIVSSDTKMLIEDNYAFSLLKTLQQDPNIRIIESTIPFDKKTRLVDFSINQKGQDEDKIYSSKKWYRSNVRRGNSFLKIFDKAKEEPTLKVVRKGFEKFFDLMYEYIQLNLNEIKDLSSLGLVSTDEHSELFSEIFGKAREALKNGQKIIIYKLVKANGENAQITWMKELEVWLIASKNVSLTIRKEQDIELYKDDRFHFAKLIAMQWIKIVERINKSGLLEELKECMNDQTFVGEYCGNQYYQHLVKYNEIDIHFVAIVSNQSNVTCLSPGAASPIFERFNLTHVKVQNMGAFDDWNSLNQSLKQIYREVAKAYIDSEEEGSVIYLVKINENGQQETLSLSKLKTLEYRIYRKLREKLKWLIGQKNKKQISIDNFVERFRKEVEDLCKEIKPPMPLSYYFKVANEAAEFVKNYSSDSSIIQDHYITFISCLMYYLSQGQKLSPDNLTQENFQKILPISWKEYYTKYMGKDETNFDSKMLVESPSKDKVQVFVLVPIGIPGMGKTYFVETLKKFVQENGCGISVVSSDKIRLECIERLSHKNKRLSVEQLFEKTGKEARNVFNDRLRELILTSNKRHEAHFIFIDKNHPPNAIKGTIDLIRGSSNHLSIEIIAVTPLMNEDFLTYEEEGKTHQYPFSPHFFFSCLSRVQARKEHETLPGNGVNTAGVLIMFLHMFRNVSLKKDSLLSSGFDEQLKIPFTAETKQIPIPKNLLNSLYNVLLVTNVGEKCNDNVLLGKLNEDFESSQLHFNNPEPTFVYQSVEKFFQEQVLPKISKNKSLNLEDVEEIKDQDDNTIKIRGKMINIDDPRKQNQDDEYNPLTTPVYLGLFVQEDPTIAVREYVLRGLSLLSETYPYERAILNTLKDLQEGASNDLHFIKNFHITSLYIGNNSKKKETKYFKTFKPRHQMEVEIEAFVIVPNKIAAALCFPDQSVISIENRFPHMTLMKGRWPPQVSNDVLEALFGRSGPLKEKYKNREFETMQEFTFKTPIKISSGTGVAFVVKTMPNIKILVEARASDDPPNSFLQSKT